MDFIFHLFFKNINQNSGQMKNQLAKFYKSVNNNTIVSLQFTS